MDGGREGIDVQIRQQFAQYHITICYKEGKILFDDATNNANNPSILILFKTLKMHVRENHITG